MLNAIEQSSLMVWIRESGSLWGYPTILFLHTLGLATVAGLNAGLDLRILGFAPKIPLGSLRGFFPLMWAAFVVTAVTGTILLATDAASKLASPVFYFKMFFIVLALVNMQMLKTRIFDRPDLESIPLSASARVLSLTSLFFWIAATMAGRLMAYLGPVSGLD